MFEFKGYANSLKEGRLLSYDQAHDFQNLILKNEFEEADLVSVFGYLEKRPLSYEELKGFYDASKQAMIKVETNLKTLDTCGTGGDNSGSFNISTAAAIICAGIGVPVAKHGNRAASSQCGSADVLESLGVKIDLEKLQAEECLRSCGFVFLLAKNFHPAFRFAAGARKTFGKKTFFNLLGPLLNPAGAEYRVHGFSDPSQVENLGKILIESGVKKAWLVHSQDGLDEISPSAPTRVWEFTGSQKIKTFNVNPEDYGFKNLKLSGIKGGDSKTNAKIIKNVLKGEANEAQIAASVLNAAAGLVVYGKAKDVKEGVEASKEAINSGKALLKLNQLISPA